MDSVTITMPPFFFYSNRKRDTQLSPLACQCASLAVEILAEQHSILASGVGRGFPSLGLQVPR
jgi:hypothetical protein